MTTFNVIEQILNRNPGVEKNRRSTLNIRMYGYKLMHNKNEKGQHGWKQLQLSKSVSVNK